MRPNVSPNRLLTAGTWRRGLYKTCVSAPSPESSAFELAALFWFYTAFDVCKERLRELRLRNPRLKIYALYGGPAGEAEEARRTIGPLCDDFYAHPGFESAHEKWIAGDRMIAGWHVARGAHLKWDSLFIVQWDFVTLSPLADLVPGLARGEAAFSGDRPLAEVSAWWGWAGAGTEAQAADLAKFRELLAARYAYDGPLWCCLFIAAVLPRQFLDEYARSGPPKPGFLEYKLPTLARVFGVPVRPAPALRTWWRADPSTRTAPASERAMSASKTPIDPALIRVEALRPDGRRAFHPVPFALQEQAP